MSTKKATAPAKAVAKIQPAAAPSTELTLPQRASKAIGLAADFEKGLRKLVASTKDLIKVTNAAGREQVHAAYMALKNQRLTIEKQGKKARQDARDFAAAVIAEENRLAEITAAEEARLAKLRDDWDTARRLEREEAEAKETARVNAIQERINDIRNLPIVSSSCRTSGAIEQHIGTLTALRVDEETFEEFEAIAADAKVASLARLEELLKAKRQDEADRAELAKRRQQDEADRLAREAAEAERQRQIAADNAELQRQRDAIAAENAEIERRRQATTQAEADLAARQRADEARQAAAGGSWAAIAPAVSDVEPEAANGRPAGCVCPEGLPMLVTIGCPVHDDVPRGTVGALANPTASDEPESPLSRRSPVADGGLAFRAHGDKSNPGAGELLFVVSDFFDVDRTTALDWLCQIAWCNVDETGAANV